MMNKKIIVATLCLSTVAAMAQETYESAQLATEDLNGTARYVGMGGAMEALGADISTIGSNPAGIGLFRKSWIGISGGATFQSGNALQPDNGFVSSMFGDNSVANADLNQFGFVYSTQSGSESWFNFAVNYHKSRNFNMIANAINTMPSGSSLNAVSTGRFLKYDEETMADILIYNALNSALTETVIDEDGNEYKDYGYYSADRFVGRYDNSGYIGEYDINFSGNFNNRVYLGVSVGLKDVHYNSSTYYKERLIPADGGIGELLFADSRMITGSGFDLKFGIIYRPVETSPFRIGAYIHTPTWYDLDAAVGMAAYSDLGDGKTHADDLEYKYKITTPWKFGLSIGHTFDNIVAFGATYEYADYSFIKNKIVFDDDHTIFSPDYDMDRNTKHNLCGVSTFKVGLEVKPVPEVALRMGYNYVSPMYNTYASKDISISPNEVDGSNGSYFSTYDYVNWKSTNRLTFGLGFTLTRNLNLDLSYQYATQKGDYYPFSGISLAELEGPDFNTVPTSIKNDRHQINATLGYRF